jgi:methylmalonyl-CoA/ethylmalonyl-CoA epimerase
MEPFFKRCQVLGVDHVAVTTPVFEQTVDTYLAMPGAVIIKGPGWNDSQKVHYAFVELSEGYVIEILGPGDDSSLNTHLKKGGGPHHICYRVADITVAVEQAVKMDSIQISKPKPDPVFDGKPVAFLFNRTLGLFEFVQA